MLDPGVGEGVYQSEGVGRGKWVCALVHAALPCFSYALSSAYMTIAQKYVLMNTTKVKAIFLFYQSFTALAFYFPAALGMLTPFKVTPYKFWDTSVAAQVLPLGITFSIMLYTSNWSLSLLTVPTITALKNVGPIFITIVEAFQGEHRLRPRLVVASLLLLQGSLVVGYYDLSFDGLGYAVMCGNVISNVVHVLLMKRLSRRGVRKAAPLESRSYSGRSSPQLPAH